MIYQGYSFYDQSKMLEKCLIPIPFQKLIDKANSMIFFCIDKCSTTRHINTTSNNNNNNNSKHIDEKYLN